MAKSSKSKTGKSKTDAIEATAADVSSVEEATQSPSSRIEDALDKVHQSTADQDIPDDEDGLTLEPVEGDDLTDAEIDLPDDAPVDAPEEPATFDTPPPAPAPAENAGAGFFPMLLGGIAAGGIGYGIATYFPGSGDTDQLRGLITAQSDQIAALEAQLANAPEVDMSAIEGQIASTAEATSQQVADLTITVTDTFDALDSRLTEVEKRPGTDGTLSETALAAYERELEELRADLNAQQENVMSAAAQAEADLAAARAEAEQLEQEALAAAEAAAARAALNRIATAVDTGAPFGDALSGLPGDVPAALADASAEGVATTAELTAAFPAAARAALATARSEGVSDDAGGFGGFLRSQFDVRSTAPREGSGPDAVLSRAEAAVKEGRVADALAEIEALPEVARAELTDWTAQATERADVLDALATLSETYN